MTRIDFYILADPGFDAGLRFACALAVKASKDALRTHIHVENETVALELDELMWDYPQHRFLPHKIVTAGADGRDCAVHIGFDTPLIETGVLINLAPEVPGFFGRFDRVAEIIVESTREAGRERFRHYRERGYPLYDHHLNNWEQAN